MLFTRWLFTGLTNGRCKRFYDGELPPPTCDDGVSSFGRGDGRNWRFPSALVLFIDSCDVNEQILTSKNGNYILYGEKDQWQ